MRRAITIGYRHGADTPVVLTGPEVPEPEHKAALKKARAQRSHPEFARVEIWTNADATGKRFLTPEELAARSTLEAAESKPEPKRKAKAPAK